MDGRHDLEAWAELSDGRSGPVVTATLWLDREPPQVEPTFIVIDSVTLMDLTGSDNVSGISWAGIWEGGNWLTYTRSLAFASAQTTTVRYYGRDRAGNRSAIRQVDVPPVEEPYGLALGVDTTQKHGPPEGTVVYTVHVTNTGVAKDSYMVTSSGGNWSSRSLTQIGPPPIGQSADLIVVVDVPPDATVYHYLADLRQ